MFPDSSPAVANGVVYVGSGDGNIYALNANTGAKLWNYTTGGPVDSSPAVANGVVYVGSADSNIYALNATTGTKLWSYATADDIYLSSPAVANGVVYIGSQDYNVYAVDTATGTRLWSYATGGNVDSSPAVANGVVYIGSYDGNIYALNATTGAKLWSYTTAGTIFPSSPAVTNGVVYIGSNDDNLYSFSISSSSLAVAPNVGCKSSWGSCSGNIVFANGAETTSLTAIVTPPQQAEITLSTNFGQVSNIGTGSSGLGTGSFTAGMLSFGWSDTTTVPATVSGTIGSQQFPTLTQIFNYAAFDFHQSQVTDAEFTDANAMSASAIQSFLDGQGSFMSKLVIISDQGGFIDQNGNGKLDKGEQVYVSSPPQECNAPCGPFALGSTGMLASSVFENAATTYGINPEVLLATAEKENSLVVAGKLPGVGALNWAMGCGKASDFLSQINCSANTFATQFGLTPSEPFFLQEPKFNIQHYVTGIGRQVVAFQIQTAATYAQYRYTPFIQSSATGGGVYLFESIWAAYGF
ncbi:MAG: PQQ-binding-like beta-propeller repeat protein [Candidatus Sulfotelmatobacter sp.]